MWLICITGNHNNFIYHQNVFTQYTLSTQYIQNVQNTPGLMFTITITLQCLMYMKDHISTEGYMLASNKSNSNKTQKTSHKNGLKSKASLRPLGLIVSRVYIQKASLFKSWISRLPPLLDGCTRSIPKYLRELTLW